MVKVNVYGLLGACPTNKMDQHFRTKDHFTQTETITKALKRQFEDKVEIEYIDKQIHGFEGHDVVDSITDDDLPFVTVDGVEVSRGKKIDFKAVREAVKSNV